MCGIIGYVGEKRATDVLLKGLKRLEYRGYDSSGVAVFRGKNIEIFKAAGKITEIEPMVAEVTNSGANGGIGHTRWATHGKPNTVNAHPHRVEDIVLVHNGIIENYREIQELVIKKGFQPKSETDSELFAFLVLFEMQNGFEFVEAVRQAFMKITGSSSVVVMCERHPGLIVGIRNGSPLVASADESFGTILASDAQPILDYSKTVTFLENGDMVICRENKMEFRDLLTGKTIDRKSSYLDWSADRLDKNGYPHYMLKEIHEQSRTIVDTLNAYFQKSGELPFEFTNSSDLTPLLEATRLTMVACGTSWHASMMGKYWLETMAKIPVDAELASEFRYRNPVIRDGQVVLGISQSGETADTLAVIQDVNRHQVPTLAITNVKSSTISREAKTAFHTYAGPEIGVASTKAFTAQMLMLLILAGRLARENAIADSSGKEMNRLVELYQELYEVPHHLTRTLEISGKTYQAIKRAAIATQHSKGFFFIGRGYSFPLALEGALKLKEIAYVHAEGYAAGELKHGPIAMLEPDFTVVVLAPKDAWHEKTISNLQEVKARGAKVIAIGCANDEKVASMADFFIPLPESANRLDESLLPFLLAPVLQVFSYEMAVMKGTDVDQPRNLAKSVTVE